MTEEEFAELLESTPTLYHMAEHNSWPSIKERGLLSTMAILDLYGIEGDERRVIEEVRRPSSVAIEHVTLPPIVIRDQLPMTDGALEKCLQDGLVPSDWYRLLNGKVFFWLSSERLLRLLGARAYRDKMHDILEIDTHSIVTEYRKRITLSPINSGSTIFAPQPRGLKTFSPIDEYDYAGRPKDNRVAELVIDYSVPDIKKYVQRVVEMQGNKEIRPKTL